MRIISRLGFRGKWTKGSSVAKLSGSKGSPIETGWPNHVGGSTRLLLWGDDRLLDRCGNDLMVGPALFPVSIREVVTTLPPVRSYQSDAILLLEQVFAEWLFSAHFLLQHECD